MPLALFDLDHTLLNGDSSHAWNIFVAEQGLVDQEPHLAANTAFNTDYHNGTLDVMAYEEFTMAVLPAFEPDALESLRQTFMRTIIRPMLMDTAAELLDHHRRKGDFLLLVTATNRFIAEPIAHALRMDDMIGAIPEMKNGRFTGKLDGVACFGENKITHLRMWLDRHQELSMDGSYFYSDSRNDLPLLEIVEHPVAVNPDPVLLQSARQRGWPVISLR